MVLHHTQFGVTSLSASKTFYLAALAPLGYKEIFNFGDKQIGLGANGKPDLWLKDVGADGLAVKGLHLAFAAESRQVVDEFYQAALKAGAKDNGPPGERNYVPGYYAAFVLDLDGNNIEVVAYVWGAPWSAGTVLFFLNRYLSFVDTFISFKLKFSLNKPEICESQFKVVTYMYYYLRNNSTATHLRNMERRRAIFISLCIVAAAGSIPAIVITQLEIMSLRYLPSNSKGCKIGAASPVIIFAYILLMLEETVIVILTGVKAFRYLRHSQSPWVIQLYRDGLIFYVYCLIISIANVLVPILAPRGFANWLATPQRIIHSVLCTRVLLLIMKQRSPSNMTTRIPRTGDARGLRHRDLVFASFVDEEISTNMTTMAPMGRELPSTSYPDASTASGTDTRDASNRAEPQQA